MTVSLLEILGAARAHAAPLAAESAGYLLLAAADSVAGAPRLVAGDEVELSSDGSVRLRGPGVPTTSDAGAELALRRLLERSLEVASSVGPALRRAASRREPAGLEHLVRELEVALIPVNRAAARRALSRLYRETERARSAGNLVAAPVEDVAPSAAAAVARQTSQTMPSVPVEPAVPSRPLEPLSERSPLADEFPDLFTAPPLPLLPDVVSAPPPPLLELPELTPEPLPVQAESALTKPEPVVQRARARGASTPTLGTVSTAQTQLGDETELTERAPSVLEGEGLELATDVDVELQCEPQVLVDPEPSAMPDVLLAMVALHTGVEADEAPTRLRDVVTAPRESEPESEPVDDAWLTQSSLEEVTTGVLGEPPAEEPLAGEETVAALLQAEEPLVVLAPAPLFVSELTDPVVHEALTWDPGPVRSSLSPLPPSLLIAAPAPEPSPYAPAALPAQTSDVSELLDSFYVSEAPEERDLRGALKEMAGLEPTPVSQPLVEEA